MSLLALFVKKINLACFSGYYLFIKSLLTLFNLIVVYASIDCKFINNWLIKFSPENF